MTNEFPILDRSLEICYNKYINNQDWSGGMIKKLRAVTTAEMLIVLLIIGILAVMALVTIKPYDKTFKWLYVRMYHALETAVYNSMMTRSEFPQTSTEFCDMLLEYINSPENNCNAGDLSRDAVDFPEANIKIVASNGMYLWIAANGGAPYVHTEVIDGSTVSMKYYVVFADINGNRAPNVAQRPEAIMEQWTSESKLVDIVAFVVTEASVVVPIGPPEIDTRYMQAMTIYPPEDENRPEGNHSKPSTYYWAKNDAWGRGKSISEPMSLDFREDFPADGPFYVDYPEANLVNQTKGCTQSNNLVSPCYVKIEEYN